MSAYSRDGYNNIQNDLKIFCGKKEEIASVQRAGRVVPNKIYLAWDTGEIYIANQSARLYQYGCSYEDVKKMINNATDTKFDSLMNRINTISDVISKEDTSEGEDLSIIGRLNKLENILNNSLDEEIVATIERKLTSSEIQDALEEIINNKIFNNNNFQDTLFQILDRYRPINEETMNNAIKSNIENKTVQFSSGGNIKLKIESGLDGIYFCISEYADDTYDFKAGSFYRLYKIDNETYCDLIPISNIVESYIKPNIIIADIVKKEYGESLNGLSFSYCIENFQNIDTSKKLIVNYIKDNVSTPIYRETDDITPLQIGTITINTDIIVKYGMQYIELEAIDIKGNTVTTVLPIEGYAPFYYGALPTSTFDIEQLNSLIKTDNKTDSVNIETNDGDYIFILSDTNLYIYIGDQDQTSAFSKSAINIHNGNEDVNYYIYSYGPVINTTVEITPEEVGNNE